MRIWLSQHVAAFAAALEKLVRAPLGTLLNVGVIGVTLALPVGLHVGLSQMQALSGGRAAAPQLSLFLARDADAADAAGIEQRLQSHAAVARYRFVPRAEALLEIKESTGLAEVVDTLERNPLPDAFVVDATDGTPQSLEALRSEFSVWPKIEHVQLDSAWAQRLDALLAVGRLTALILGALLAFALIAVTFNTIRLQILTQRDEIELAGLIGATRPFIRRPFLYFGTLTGLAGGAAAWSIVAAAIYLLNDALSALSALYGLSLRLHPPVAGDAASLLIFSAWLGWMGARLSVGRHLSDMAPA